VARTERHQPPAGSRRFRVLGRQFDGDMDETIVEEADYEAGFAGHRRVGGMTREDVAEDCVFAVRRPAADLVARIEIPHHDRNFLCLKIRLDTLTQKQADIF
jgi:hypothetical protein